jgi:beta-galactosidase GanA
VLPTSNIWVRCGLKLLQMNLNSVVAPVYWELIEPAEGIFDFELVDGLIQKARKNNLKLVLLWF